jgi:hypothetical protein
LVNSRYRPILHVATCSKNVPAKLTWTCRPITSEVHEHDFPIIRLASTSKPQVDSSRLKWLDSQVNIVSRFEYTWIHPKPAIYSANMCARAERCIHADAARACCMISNFKRIFCAFQIYISMWAFAAYIRCTCKEDGFAMIIFRVILATEPKVGNRRWRPNLRDHYLKFLTLVNSMHACTPKTYMMRLRACALR